MRTQNGAKAQPKKKGLFKRLFTVFMALVWAVLLCIVVTLVISGYIQRSVKGDFVTAEEADAAQADCILVLGCGVIGDDTPSAMLKDRLDRAIDLYFAGVSGKILMSGDHGRVNYDEVNVMKEYAIEAGVPSEDIFMDHAGFSTYESMYRARDIFEVGSAVIVTQSYHLYRALYIAERLGISAVGVSADTQEYARQAYRQAREILAQVKDFFMCIFKPEPTFLGETIPVWGNGDATNDKEYEAAHT